ncbi:MAG: YkgJ family cysteine cluster protein [Methanospirillum sp.]
MAQNTFCNQVSVPMSFYCLRCGECCSAMGAVHALEGDPATGRCVVVNRYTGERTSVAVDPDKSDQLSAPPVPGACPLFRRDADGRGVCPVHETWPAVCAEYGCWRLLVLDPAGRRAARVMGSRHVAVDDPSLEAALAPHRAALARAVDDLAWDAILTDALGRAGYRVVR